MSITETDDPIGPLEPALDEETLGGDGSAPVGTWSAAMRMWRTRVGVVFVVALVALAIIGPFVAPFGEQEFVATPNTRHVEGTMLGTDYFGQDVWSRFLFGGRSIIVLATLATLLGLVGGAGVGLVAAYARGAVDNALMRVMDLLLAFPQLLIALVALTMIGPKPWLIVVLVGTTTMPRIARIVRGTAVEVVQRDFVSAAEALGESRTRIITRELLPNVSGPLLVEANLRLTYSVGIIAGLGFLGFATSANGADWGRMIQENQGALSVQPWGVILPSLAIALMTIGTGLMADGLARAISGIDRGRANQ
ncbi:MAG: ABC transporter permease [Desertimonas sp.]